MRLLPTATAAALVLLTSACTHAETAEPSALLCGTIPNSSAKAFFGSEDIDEEGTRLGSAPAGSTSPDDCILTSPDRKNALVRTTVASTFTTTPEEFESGEQGLITSEGHCRATTASDQWQGTVCAWDDPPAPLMIARVLSPSGHLVLVQVNFPAPTPENEQAQTVKGFLDDTLTSLTKLPAPNAG